MASESPPPLSPQFEIQWPPTEKQSAKSTPPLLVGEILTKKTSAAMASLEVHLERLFDEEARHRWNQKLAYPEYSWMARVRVWDKNRQWLWPNLACLLTAHGRDRMDRYGGLDPEKKIDNDFAAVLIRPLKQDRPAWQSEELLVSAQWYSVGHLQPTLQSIAHRAQSDTFVIELTESQPRRLGVWIIYADFLGSRAPRTWPKEEEFNGGILAFLEVEMKLASGKLHTKVTSTRPPSWTGFDWEKWSTDEPRLPKALRLD